MTNSSETSVFQCAAQRLIENKSNELHSNNTEEFMLSELQRYIGYFGGTGVYVFFVTYLGITFWTWTGERQVRRIRTAYFEAVMRQSVGWFDEHKSGELNSHMVEDMERLSDGFGDKMATFVQWLSTSIGGFVLAFSVGWKLSLVAAAVCPGYVLALSALSRFVRKFVKKEMQAYAKAGAAADETFSSIRTVAAFGGEKKAEQSYFNRIVDALKEAQWKSTWSAIMSGAVLFLGFSVVSLTIWYGAKLTRDDCLPPGAIIQVFFGVMVGCMYLANAVPLLENFANARAAASTLFKMIDTKVEIDSSSEEGLKPETIQGEIEFQDVSFSYPLRKEVKVLNGLTLSVKKEEKVALVGESGCGKSTAVKLVQRFYDCDDGSVLIDGQDLKSYNLHCLRNYMGIVSQEPVLFATTIGDNIRLGAKWKDEVTQERIEQAAKQANCYDFICQLPQGFDTPVGDRGVQLSGGQKQRIAIARALVRDPAILLLDEATSALDTQSESVVQEALDKAGRGRTTLVIAHRLSTVKLADKIYVFQNGAVHEMGTHDSLMSLKGVYYSLVMRQLREDEKEEKTHKNNQQNGFEAESHLKSKEEQSPSDYKISVPTASSPKTTSPDGIHKLSQHRHDSIYSTKQTLNDKRELSLEEGIEKTTSVSSLSALELLTMNIPELPMIVIGTLGAVLTGCAYPVFSILLSELIGVLSEPDLEIQRQKVSKLASYTITTGAVTGLSKAVQHFTFSMTGEKLTARLRKKTFSSLVRQEISFFDEEENGTALLNTRLSADAPLVKGALVMRIGILAESGATILGALIIALVHVWEVALVAVVFVPIMMIAGKVQQNMARGYSVSNKLSIVEGGKMAQEAISNMRTVTSLNRQRYFTDNFRQHFKNLYLNDKKKAFIYGFAYSLSQSLMFFMYTIVYGFGGYLCYCDCIPWRDASIPFYYIVRIYVAVVMGSLAAGKTASQLPDYPKAKMAACNVNKILTRKSLIDSSSGEGATFDTIEGRVEFNQVEFSYPTREEVKVLQKTTFSVESGKTFALVGASGCGKSTSISLLERFYDSISGQVAIDGEDVKSLNIQWLRHQLGMVSQEPTLFDMTIRENIAYGDNRREVAIDEIIEAARKANAHGFITSLPKGYETNVGAKGTQLSGGQKQRIAIARALVRNPAILLLDEATSALDAESEKIVQEALERAMAGRTAIIIAHRLSTIKNANKIGVIEDGRIVEMGSHEELIEKKGCYYNLIQAQL
ncbi:ATP-dependent translocase ABCB1-like [Watersipora subatra]|uniref:ATP-dependent translocase ABCB1-like n=1 Tax=Watersipora subatra TaxID=2589382 RepID=UPI00355B0088